MDAKIAEPPPVTYGCSALATALFWSAWVGAVEEAVEGGALS
jgi:hypothetical protein